MKIPDLDFKWDNSQSVPAKYFLAPLYGAMN